MAINMEVAQELMTDFASDAYAILQSQYPDFLVYEWEDQIQFARMVSNGTVLEPEDMHLVETWANEAGAPSIGIWSIGVLNRYRQIVTMRQTLASLYRSSLQQAGVAAAVSPETLPEVFGKIIQTAGATMHGLAQGNEEIREHLMNALNEMAASLQEAMADG